MVEEVEMRAMCVMMQVDGASCAVEDPLERSEASAQGQAICVGGSVLSGCSAWG